MESGTVHLDQAISLSSATPLRMLEAAALSDIKATLGELAERSSETNATHIPLDPSEQLLCDSLVMDICAFVSRSLIEERYFTLRHIVAQATEELKRYEVTEGRVITRDVAQPIHSTKG